jgi:5-methylthioadenosine/S-adenosylhomocysteine deaminase
MKMIEGRYVITMDGNRRVIRNGGVLYDRDQIIAVGKRDDIKKEYKIDEIIGGKNFVVMPGLINTHMHLELSFFRGLWESTSLYLLKNSIAKVVPHMKDEDLYIGSLLSLIDLVKNGVTTTIQISLQAEKAAEAITRIGTRGVVCSAMQDREIGEIEAPPRSTNEVLEENINLVKKWNGAANGRIRAWFGPYTELLASPELLQRTDELADKYNTGIHIHLAETYESQMLIQRMYGKRVFEYVYDTGILDSNVIAAHACWLSEKEIKIIKKTGTNIAYCPCVEMMISDGIAPASRLLSENINLSTALDCNSNNQTSDLFRDARVASLIQKNIPLLDPEVMPSEQMMETITVNPAKALIWDKEIGSLEPGKKADILLIDIKKPYFMPIVDIPKTNIISNLINAGSGNDVHTVIVNGKTIVKDRLVQTLNEEEIMVQFQEAAENLINRSKYKVQKGLLGWPIE